MEELVLAWLQDRGPEIVAAIFVGGASAAATSFYKGWLVQRRVRQVIGAEIVSIQSHLYARANPDVWKQDDLREKWMLNPFIRHIGLLESLSDRERLSANVQTAISKYHQAATKFVAAWSEAQKRGANKFWKPYQDLFDAGEECLISLKQFKAHSKAWRELSQKARPED